MTRGKHKMLKRLGVFIGLAALLLLAGMIFIASKLSGDEEVLDDIDRHFESLEKSSSYVAYYEAEKKNNGEPSGDERTLAGDLSKKRSVKSKRESGKKRRAKKKSSPKVTAAPSSSATHLNGIRHIAPGTFLIDEKLAKAAQQSPKSFIKGVRARLIPHNNKPLGFQLSGISPMSPVYALGLRDGDVILAVNGFQLKSIDEAIMAATSCRFAKKFRVDIKRGAKRQSFYYRIDVRQQ